MSETQYQIDVTKQPADFAAHDIFLNGSLCGTVTPNSEVGAPSDERYYGQIGPAESVIARTSTKAAAANALIEHCVLYGS